MADSILSTRMVEEHQAKREREKDGWIPMPTEHRRGAERWQGLGRMSLCSANDTQVSSCGAGLGLWPGQK